VRKISGHEDEFAFRSAVSKNFVRLGFKKNRVFAPIIGVLIYYVFKVICADVPCAGGMRDI